MKTLLPILTLIITLSSCSNSVVVITDAEIPEDVFYLKDDIKPFTGKCITYFHNSENIKEEMHFVAGILQGTATTYYANGTIKRQGEYENGKMHGKWACWYPDGKQSYVVHYNDDILSGTYTAWYDTGVMKEKGNYANNSRLGTWTQYDQAGMVSHEEKIN